jgi:hypothetical protein
MSARIEPAERQVTNRLLSRAGYTILTLTLAVTTTLFFAYRKGQDANWDQLNYHLAMPFLLLHGVLWDSVAPAGIQTYLNPLILIPQYILLRGLPPLVAAGTIAATQAIAFVVAGRICIEIAPAGPRPKDYRPALLGFLLCLASPMALSEAGTTIVDLLLAIPVLLAYHLLLTREDAGAPRLADLYAGLLLGAATGLKMTNAIFAIGAPAFYLTGQSHLRHRIGGLAQLAVGGLLGFVIVAGFWHFELWHRLHNPIFPYFNTIFHAPAASESVLRDARFLPKSGWDVIMYPVYWLVGGSPTPGLPSPASETDPKDARFILALILLPFAVVTTLLHRRHMLFRCETGLLAAWAIDYIVWLFVFGIHRYFVVGEILCGVVLLILTSWMAAGRWRLIVLLALAVITLARIHVASWARLPWGPHWRTIARTTLTLPDRPLIFLMSKPMAYVALALPATTRYVGFDPDLDLSGGRETVLTRQVREEIRTTPGSSRFAVLAGPPPQGAVATLASYGLRLTPECRDFAIAETRFQLCHLTGP